MSRVIFSLFLITASLNAVAQLLLKYGASRVTGHLSSSENLFVRAAKILFNPYILTAVIILASGMFLWIYLISRINLSQAYPVNIALTILITSIAAAAIFRESLTAYHIAGIVLIIFGIWMVLKTS